MRGRTHIVCEYTACSFNCILHLAKIFRLYGHKTFNVNCGSASSTNEEFFVIEEPVIRTDYSFRTKNLRGEIPRPPLETFDSRSCKPINPVHVQSLPLCPSDWYETYILVPIACKLLSRGSESVYIRYRCMTLIEVYALGITASSLFSVETPNLLCVSSILAIQRPA